MMKARTYTRLIADRKACHICCDLKNPADLEGGRFDSEHVGAWSLWQGNLDASLMVVGQDWGDTKYFVQHKGREGPRNPTNLALVKLIAKVGIMIGEPGSESGRDVAFFTNAILCLKRAQGGLQGKVQRAWFDNCASFLRRQIEIVHPVVVVGPGEHAYRAILRGFAMECGSFRSEVAAAHGKVLPNGSRAFAVYHCGARIRNTHRPMDMQREDWARFRRFLIPNR